MRILAIDPGAKCGVAWSCGHTPTFSTLKLKGDWPNKLIEFYRGIVCFDTRCIVPDVLTPEIVAIEKIYAPRSRLGKKEPSKPNIILLQRYVGVAALFAAQVRAEFIEIPTQSWKSALNLPLSATPDQYQKAVKVIMKLKELPGPDEAAALGILYYAMTRHGG